MRRRDIPETLREAEQGSPPSRTPSRTPDRTCVGCRQLHPKAMLIRVVCDPTNQLLVDLQGKLPGRGAYVCLQRPCVEQALKGTRLPEALRRAVAPCSPDELVQAMANKLAEQGMACIRMARKAGRLVSGYTQVRQALQHAPVALLLVAEDTAPDRLREYRTWCVNRRIPYRSFLTKARLGELVGRDESSAIGIQDTRLADRLTFYLEGVSRLRAG